VDDFNPFFFVKFMMFRLILFVAVIFLSTCTKAQKGDLSPVDHTFQQWYANPPPEVKAAAFALSQYAQSLVDTVFVNESVVFPFGSVDIVCSGGGNMAAYYMGVHLAMSRVSERYPSRLRRVRYGGASAGGELPFQIWTTGQEQSMLVGLMYGKIMEIYPDYFQWYNAAFTNDASWRLLAKWITSNLTQNDLGNMTGFFELSPHLLGPLPLCCPREQLHIT